MTEQCVNRAIKDEVTIELKTISGVARSNTRYVTVKSNKQTIFHLFNETPYLFGERKRLGIYLNGMSMRAVAVVQPRYHTLRNKRATVSPQTQEMSCTI